MQITQQHLDTIVVWAKYYGARKVILFGSALETPDDAHDIDLACDIPGLGMFAFAGKIEEELHAPIDVVPLLPRNHFIESVELHGKVLYEVS
jgi:uncharacterized protein